MHCINHEIEALVDGLESDDDDYLLLGHLMDRLVHSEDKFKELEELGAIPGFSEFRENLIAGVKYLRSADLDSERMKIEIEKLAQSMFTSSLDALQNHETKSELRRILGISVPQEEQQSDLKMDEPSFEEPVLSEPDINLDSHFDVQPSMDEMDLTDENGLDTDVKKVGGYQEDSVTEEGGSSKIVDTSESEARISREPASLVHAFEVDAESQLVQLKKHLQALNHEPDAPEHWQESDALFDAIIAGAMIYGFDGFEQLSAKARRLISQCSHEPPFDLLDAVAVLEETVDFLWENIKTDPEKTDANAVRHLSQKLSSPPKRPHLEVTADEELKKNESDDAEFKLPGEDDEEILQLLKEISRDEKGTSTSAPIRIEPEAIDVDFAAFQEQAKLYYIIIEEALTVIERNREDAQAFEDLEIAASSLSDLVFKMKLEQIREFPDLLLSVAQNSLSTSYLLSDADHQLLLEAFEQFRLLRNSNDTHEEDFIKVLELMKGLNSKIQLFLHNQDDFRMKKSDSMQILGE